jgi:copper transporter 1
VRTNAEFAWSQSIALRREAAQLQPLAASASVDDDSQDSLAKGKDPVAAKEIQEKERAQRLKHLAHAPPFIPAIDVARALLFAFQAFVGYLLMLAVMTYDAWFFIAVILGLAVGEGAFGRWAGGHDQADGVHI